MASIDNHQGDCANDQETHQRVIKIDPDGDLTLVVGRTKTRFLVCSRTLSRSAPFWKQCLYGQFKEAKPAGDQDWVVEFPEDSASAMKFVLLLVHGLGHKMQNVDLQLAFEVTVLTNKYRMTQCLWAVVRQWLEDLGPGEAVEDSIVPHLMWLWVTKELGDAEKHSSTFVMLSQTVTVAGDEDAQLYLRPYEPRDAGTLTRGSLEGYDAEKGVILLLAVEIMQERKMELEHIQRVIMDDIKNLQDAVREFDSLKTCYGAFFCRGKNGDGSKLCSKKQRLCEYAMLAIVTKMSAGPESATKPLEKIHTSVEDFLEHASSFRRRIHREVSYLSGKEHSTCTPLLTELPYQDFLGKMALTRWSEENAGAFERQARVSGLVKDSAEEEQIVLRRSGGQHLRKGKRVQPTKTSRVEKK